MTSGSTVEGGNAGRTSGLDRAQHEQFAQKEHRQTAGGSLRQQKKARARALILNSAQKLIAKEGYAQTKMRDVASTAEMSYQTLYNYFPTKALILQELLTRDLLKLHRSTFNTVHSANTPTAKLRDLAKDYIDAIAPDDRELWKEVCAELLKTSSHHSCLLDLLDKQALTKLESTLRVAQDERQLSPHIDTRTMAEVVFSLLDATLMRYLVNEKSSRVSMLASLSNQLQFCIAPHVREAR